MALHGGELQPELQPFPPLAGFCVALMVSW
jgi:hypothetical protein